MDQPVFCVTAHGDREVTGDCVGTYLEIMTPQGTVSISTGPDGKTHMSFANMPYRVVDHCVILTG